MAAIQPERADQASAGLTLNLSSNNPFRNRAVSPSLQSPASPFDDPPAVVPARPMSRNQSNNPFLDPSARAQQTPRAPDIMSNPFPEKKSPTAADLFDALTLDDKPNSSMNAPPRPDAPKPSTMNNRAGPTSGQENIPPHARRGPPGHRPTPSEEEALKRRMQQGSQDPNRSPQRRSDPRRRRNSETAGTDDKNAMSEQERRERDARRQARKDRSTKDKALTARRFDVIDVLDDSMKLFGAGVKIHHDGPYDACNPHRNREGSRRAPMQAFAKDSPNNTIGGSGPLNKRPDHATFMGKGEDEAFMDYSMGKKERSGSSSYAGPIGGASEMPVFDPTARGSILHGDESMGLGTSTFLEGTPAARADIERTRENQNAEDGAKLGRKKSLVHRLRMKPPSAHGFQPSGRLTNPEGVYGSSRRTPSGNYKTSASMMSPKDEIDPFNEEFGKNDELISVRRSGGEPRSPEQNLRLERRATAESSVPTSSGQGGGGGVGWVRRMTSKKGRRAPPPAPPQTQYPGPPGQAV